MEKLNEILNELVNAYDYLLNGFTDDIDNSKSDALDETKKETKPNNMKETNKNKTSCAAYSAKTTYKREFLSYKSDKDSCQAFMKEKMDEIAFKIMSDKLDPVFTMTFIFKDISGTFEWNSDFDHFIGNIGDDKYVYDECHNRTFIKLDDFVSASTKKPTCKCSSSTSDNKKCTCTEENKNPDVSKCPNTIKTETFASALYNKLTCVTDDQVKLFKDELNTLISKDEIFKTIPDVDDAGIIGISFYLNDLKLFYNTRKVWNPGNLEFISDILENDLGFKDVIYQCVNDNKIKFNCYFL